MIHNIYDLLKEAEEKGRILDIVRQKVDHILKSTKELFYVTKEVGGELRIVGGVIRDLLLELNGVINPHNNLDNREIRFDIDLASTLKSEDNMKLFNNICEKVIPTGLKYGSITVIKNNITFEITTLREDVECYGREAIIKYGADWKEDAARRDFTVNALSMDEEGNIYDYFLGIDDIKNRLLRFVGEADNRIKEDYLRALRYFRFLAYLGTDNIDKKSYKAAIFYANDVQKLAKERVRKEMWSMFGMPYALQVIKLLFDEQVLQYVFLPLKALSSNFDNQIKFILGNPLVNIAVLIALNENYENRCKNGVEIGRELFEIWKISNHEQYIISIIYDLMIATVKIYEGNQNKEEFDLARLKNHRLFGTLPVEYLSLDFSKSDINIALHRQLAYILGYEIYKKYMEAKCAYFCLNYEELLELFRALDKYLSEDAKLICPVNGNSIISRYPNLDKKDIGVKLSDAKIKWIKSTFTLY